MTISKYNAEGYFDPTAYEALTSVSQEQRKARFRPMVYICSPYSGDVERNTENARRYSRFAVEQGYIPQTPHLYFPQFMNDDDPEERSLALFMDIALLTKCAELWVFGDTISNGGAGASQSGSAWYAHPSLYDRMRGGALVAEHHALPCRLHRQSEQLHLSARSDRDR